MENILNSTDAMNLDKLLQSFEFENKQYVKLIEKENQQIEAYSKRIEEGKTSITHTQSAINQLDDDTKRAHKQFTQNRDNCESLRKTTVVLMEHEVALNKKLNSVVITTENDRAERNGVLQHYQNIWEDYKATYKTFPLAIKLHKEKEEFSQLNIQVEEAKKQAEMLTKQIKMAQGNDGVNFKNLNSFITKLAGMKLETTQITTQIQNKIKEKESLEKELEEMKAKKQQKSGIESMETDGDKPVETSASSSTMIGMYDNEEEDIAELNTNNNTDTTSTENNVIMNIVPSDPMHLERQAGLIPQKMEQVKPTSTGEDVVMFTTQTQLPAQVQAPKLFAIPPSIQINPIPVLHQRMPTNLTSIDKNTTLPKTSTNQLRINNQLRLLTPQITSPSTKLAPKLISCPPSLVMPLESTRPSVAPKPQPSPNTPRLFQPLTIARSPTTSNPNMSQQQQQISRTPKPTPGTPATPHISAVQNNSPLCFSKDMSPSSQTPKQTKSPLVTSQTGKSSPKTPGTPKTSTNCNEGSTSTSPFDLNKHLEKMKQMRKSPNVMPLKGRAMFAESTEEESRASSQFIQPFYQAKAQSTDSSSHRFSCFENISSPETPSGASFSFGPGAKSPTSETCFNIRSDVKSPTSEAPFNLAFDFGSGVKSPTGDNSFMSLFNDRSKVGETAAESSSFSFSFGGGDNSGAKSPEQSDFTFNFGASESQSKSNFSFF
ncbi:hypothetical protein SNE40_009202 [Patella caerulea]|uniref:Uncharacterized protein n=1 Tax=Patella caerulea TaxID=87958 RepID=A0AAN8JUL9_PATCE